MLKAILAELTDEKLPTLKTEKIALLQRILIILKQLSFSVSFNRVLKIINHHTNPSVPNCIFTLPCKPELILEGYNEVVDFVSKTLCNSQVVRNITSAFDLGKAYCRWVNLLIPVDSDRRAEHIFAIAIKNFPLTYINRLSKKTIEFRLDGRSVSLICILVIS